jgi:hemerythrin-like metal-binding protein
MTKAYKAVGHAEIDEDHSEIILFLEELSHAFDSGVGAGVINRLPNILNLLRDHFTREESFLGQVNFPNLRGHANVHQRILREAEATLSDISSNQNHDERRKQFGNFVQSMIEDIELADDEIRAFIASNMVPNEG